MRLWQEIIIYVLIGVILTLLIYPPYCVKKGKNKFYIGYRSIFTAKRNYEKINTSLYFWPVGILTLLYILLLLEFQPQGKVKNK